MIPKNFNEANTNYTKPKGWTDEQCQPLPVHSQVVDGYTVLTSCWEITDEEIEKLKETKEIWFQVYTPVQPPILLTVDKPDMPQPETVRDLANWVVTVDKASGKDETVIQIIEKPDFEIGQIVKDWKYDIISTVDAENIKVINDNKDRFVLAKNQNPIPNL